ncbi:MAG: DUF2231 domain-containing protein [bacterium]|nr:DUF2231 domain-containing protein [bacterium]
MDFSHLSQSGFHPLVVHFPIALFFVATICDAISILLRRPQKLQFTAFFLSVLGTIGAITAVITGKQAEELVSHTQIVSNLLEQHEMYANWTLWTGIGLTILRTIFFFVEKLQRVHFLILIPSVLLVYWVGQTGHLGGKMVYGYGVGVNKQTIFQNTNEMQYKDKKMHEEDEND